MDLVFELKIFPAYSDVNTERLVFPIDRFKGFFHGFACLFYLGVGYSECLRKCVIKYSLGR